MSSEPFRWHPRYPATCPSPRHARAPFLRKPSRRGWKAVPSRLRVQLRTRKLHWSSGRKAARRVCEACPVRAIVHLAADRPARLEARLRAGHRWSRQTRGSALVKHSTPSALRWWRFPREAPGKDAPPHRSPRAWPSADPWCQKARSYPRSDARVALLQLPSPRRAPRHRRRESRFRRGVRTTLSRRAVEPGPARVIRLQIRARFREKLRQQIVHLLAHRSTEIVGRHDHVVGRARGLAARYSTWTPLHLLERWHGLGPPDCLAPGLLGRPRCRMPGRSPPPRWRSPSGARRRLRTEVSRSSGILRRSICFPTLRSFG